MQISDANFIKQMKKGNPDALEYVVDQYAGLVKGVVVNTLKAYKDYYLVEECISDVFIGAYTNIKHFKGDKDDFGKWLCTIAKFKAVDKQREWHRMPIFTELDEGVSYVESAEASVMKQETTDQLLNKLSNLKAVDRKIFIMKYFLEMSNQEIAEKLNLSKAAVDNRLYRGKKVLNKKALGGLFYGKFI
ncbi:sigma-70 family RNA polymerase sigma factor [Amphibacillus cookii]|uniref:sigma-70 family RNA polymerase sigma factor n=1 Tax=Amphibacillus cookii TaxID=767787 RepID=UPI00195C32B2|nr:sigma-70 family RNA polymerase sigma factor [Amphibacillus cookii]MBM7542700.1 RNA polymerase sigma-70 factor (ECF subfamily) [Amphibacillus cookii]